MKRLMAVCILVAFALSAGLVNAHPILVDGDPSDWFGVLPANINTGHIDRDATGRGEFIWLDPPNDERTDFFGRPDPAVDLLSVRITADDTFIYFLFEFMNTLPPMGDGAPMISIGVDLDGVPGSGQIFFTGFADTSVNPAAAWEFMIQTSFGSGLPAPHVYDMGFTDNASPGTLHAISPTHVEMAVKWEDLGFPIGAFPTDPVKFTIATFHSDPMDNTWDLGGPAISDALDAVSNYGDPSLAVRNTWDEVNDQVIDYHFELWFHLDPDVEPMGPVLINEVQYDTPGDDSIEEFVELINMAGLPLPIDGYTVSDEETIDAGEGSMSLPPGALLPAGGILVLALNAAGFNGLYGIDPDFEATDTGLVPDLLPQPLWSTGFPPGFNNGGDEIHLLDRYFTIIDAVTYEGNSYPGVIDHPGVSIGESIERCQPSDDLNDGTIDMLAQATPTPGVIFPCLSQGDACGGSEECASKQCVDGVCCEDACDGICDGTCNGAVPGVCEPLVCPDDGNVCTDESCNVGLGGCVSTNNTAACDDSEPCTSGDVCAGGVCTAGGPTVCDDGNACTADSCILGTGCSYTAIVCDDGNACTVDSCNPVSGCITVPLDCDDGNPCTNDACNPVSGCVNIPNTDPCDDADTCTTNDVCAAGSCAGGPALVCNDANGCTDDSCDPASGCVNANNVDACDDANACTTNDTCAAGSCVGGAALDCNDANGCTDDSCDPASGCVNANNVDACDDANACTTNDTCAAGSCVGGAALACNDGNVCTDDSCDPASGCVNANNVDACDDADACTTNDVCAAGSCVGGAALDCDDSNVCTDDSCDSGSGCVNANNTAACDDADACTMADTCAAGACSGLPLDADGDGYVDENCPSGNDCDDGDNQIHPGAFEAAFGGPMCADTFDNDCDNLVDDADPGCSQCSLDADCEDGNLCNGIESCTNGFCQAGQQLTCDDGNVCTNDTCLPASGCVFSVNAAPCDDGDACSLSDVCAQGACSGTPVDCSNLTDACNTGTCNPADGSCQAIAAVDGTACDDADLCTDNDACTAGFCAGGAVDCTDLTDGCNLGVCNPVDGSCLAQPMADDTACDDAQACTENDVCTAGVCAGGTKDCSASTDTCNTGVCDPASGDCLAEALQDGTACDDVSACTDDDTCLAGVCAGTEKDCSTFDDICTQGVCEPLSGLCQAENLPDGSPCDDGDTCTAQDACQEGECVPGLDTCDPSGCNCSANGPAHSAGLLGLLGLLLGLVARRRR